MTEIQLEDTALVACGTLSPELEYMRKNNIINPGKIIYTKPGLHQDCKELERQLVDAVAKARASFDKVIVIYGGKFCYVNADNPTRTMSKIIDELGEGVTRIEATHCMDMMASEEEREELGEGAKIWWMTPGWVKFRNQVFEGWDKGLANENFPKHDGGAKVLDAIGLCEQYLAEKPEEILDMSDWMGIPMMGIPISLDRFLRLLSEARSRLD